MGTGGGPAIPRWPDDVYEDATRRVGRACFGLLAESPRWVHRRVEKFALLSHELFLRSLSVDFTVPELFRPSLSIPGDQWLVPLATLPKRPLRNFDLRDESGGAIPVAGREINSQVSTHALRTAAALAIGAESTTFPSFIEQRLATVSAGGSEEAEEAIGELIAAAEGGDEAASRLLEDPMAVRLLEDLSDSYLLLAVLDDIERRRVLKYSYELPQSWLGFPLRERLGWEPPIIEAEARAARETASYHAEIVIPEELRIAGSLIIDDESGATFALGGETDRASLHAPKVPPESRPLLLFGVRSERSGFPTVAAAMAWVTAAILGLGAWFADLNSEAPGAALSLVLAGSALFAGAVARAGEHRMVRTMFFVPRLVFVAGAVAGLAAGAVLVLGFCDQVVDTTWKIASIAAACAAGILSVTFLRAARSGR